jgi:dephospho-CoA kinase
MAELSVILTGTHGAGKTSVAKQLIKNHGGGVPLGEVTYTHDGEFCFAGSFKTDQKFGGSDKIGTTSKIENMVIDCKSTVFIAEGTRVGSFGINPLKALFSARKQLFVYLSVTEKTAKERIFKRNGNGITDTVSRRIKDIARAAVKYTSIGVPVLIIDANNKTIQEISDIIERAIYQLIMEAPSL